MNCEHDLRADPRDAISSGRFILMDFTKHPYVLIYTVKCKTCGKAFTVNDHQGYHYDYWSWTEASVMGTSQLLNSIPNDAELELGTYRLLQEISVKDKVLVLNFPYSVNAKQIVLYFKASGAEDFIGELVLDSESRKTISKIIFSEEEFYDRFKKYSNRSSVPLNLLIDKNKFDAYYLDLFK